MPVSNEDAEFLKVDELTFGTLVQKGGWWIGVHYSPNEKRYCLNLLPCLTIYWVMPGGYLPIRELEKQKAKRRSATIEPDVPWSHDHSERVPQFHEVQSALREYELLAGSPSALQMLSYFGSTRIHAMHPEKYQGLIDRCAQEVSRIRMKGWHRVPVENVWTEDICRSAPEEVSWSSQPHVTTKYLGNHAVDYAWSNGGGTSFSELVQIGGADFLIAGQVLEAGKTYERKDGMKWTETDVGEIGRRLGLG